jgi:TRAP-type C4-dicarboxylate transport system permease small subunit
MKNDLEEEDMSRGFGARVDQFIALFLRRSSIAMMAALIVFVAAGVLVRFLPFASMGWADEIIELAFAWLVFLGAASLWRDRTHFRVDLLPTKLGNSKAGLRLEIGLALLALGFFLVFTYQGGWVSYKATDRSPILELPKYLWYMVMPLSGAIIIGYTIRDLREFIRKRN